LVSPNLGYMELYDISGLDAVPTKANCGMVTYLLIDIWDIY